MAIFSSVMVTIAAQVDLVGGYYDAGDHVKFGLPMAFTVTMLSWSLIEYGGDVADAGELGHALEAVKWGTDYFIKAHTRPDELWAEVTQPRRSLESSVSPAWPCRAETARPVRCDLASRAKASCYTRHETQRDEASQAR